MAEVRLIDIAVKAGVSHTAVSKVLNGRPIRIGDEKREQILALAGELGYKPNILARSLRDRKSRTIGVIVPDISTLFYPSLILKVETTLSAHGYQTIICDTAGDPEAERRQMEELSSRLVDGFIVAPSSETANAGLFKRIGESGKPLVFIDRPLPEPEFQYVATDNIKAAVEGVGLLAKSGVRRLCYLGERERKSPLNERLAGVKRAASQCGMVFTEKSVRLCDVSRESAKAAFCDLFHKTDGESGLFLESNRFLMGVLDGARERGMSIPDDLKVIGFDEFAPAIRTVDDIASLGVLKSPVPYIEQDIAGMAGMACDHLLSCLDGGRRRKKLQARLAAKVMIP